MCDVKNLDAVVRLVVAVGHNEIGAADDKLARAGNPSRSAYTWKVGKVLNLLLDFRMHAVSLHESLAGLGEFENADKLQSSSLIPEDISQSLVGFHAAIASLCGMNFAVPASASSRRMAISLSSTCSASHSSSIRSTAFSTM